MDSPAVIHHINWYATGKKAPNFLVIPLCPTHHTDGDLGTAIHAGKASWEMANGTEMELLSQTLELLYQDENDTISYFHEKARVRAERMEAMREWMTHYYGRSCWTNFIRGHDDRKDWFDDKGQAK